MLGRRPRRGSQGRRVGRGLRDEVKCRRKFRRRLCLRGGPGDLGLARVHDGRRLNHLLGRCLCRHRPKLQRRWRARRLIYRSTAAEDHRPSSWITGVGHTFGRQPRRPSHPSQMPAEELDWRAGVVNRRGLYASGHQDPTKEENGRRLLPGVARAVGEERPVAEPQPRRLEAVRVSDCRVVGAKRRHGRATGAPELTHSQFRLCRRWPTCAGAPAV